MITLLAVHCSATEPSMDIGLAEIKDWHTLPKPKGNGWSDVGYHYIIRRDGTVEKGRPDDRSGAHIRGHNADSLGICMVGGINTKGAPDSNFTAHQYGALFTLLTSLTRQYPEAKVDGHRSFDSGKACPSFDIKSFWYGE